MSTRNYWIMDRFVPSDGSKVAGGLVDHRAEIKCQNPNGGATYMFLQCGAHGIDEAGWKNIVDRVLAGLNA